MWLLVCVSEAPPQMGKLLVLFIIPLRLTEIIQRTFEHPYPISSFWSPSAPNNPFPHHGAVSSGACTYQLLMERSNLQSAHPPHQCYPRKNLPFPPLTDHSLATDPQGAVRVLSPGPLATGTCLQELGRSVHVPTHDKMLAGQSCTGLVPGSTTAVRSRVQW